MYRKNIYIYVCLYPREYIYIYTHTLYVFGAGRTKAKRRSTCYTKYIKAKKYRYTGDKNISNELQFTNLQNRRQKLIMRLAAFDRSAKT